MLDLACAVEAWDDDRLEPDIGAALGTIAELAAPRLAGVNDAPHVFERLQGVLAGAQQLVGLPEELGLGIADDFAEPLVHLEQVSVAVGDRYAEVVFERLPVAVEAVGDLGIGDRQHEWARRKPAAYCSPVAKDP